MIISPDDDRPAPDPQTEARPRILFVDDEIALCELATTILTDAGFEVLQAYDGAQALNCLKIRPEIDLVISDVIMPRMDGEELLQTLRTQRPDLKIALITGHPDIERIERLQAQDVTILLKPFDLERMARLALAMTGSASRMEANNRL
jgi:DNA-binding NtrC family response regulator